MERVCIFIDGSNFYFGLKRNNRVTRVDYYQLGLALAGPDRELVRTFYYNATYDRNLYPDKSKTQLPFLDSLDRTPYLELRLGRLVPNHENGFQERGVEILMASELVYYAARNMFDTAIVITEDPDYAIALEQVKEIGKSVEVALFPDGQTKELVQISDNRIALDTVLNQYASKIFPPDMDENRGNVAERMNALKKSF